MLRKVEAKFMDAGELTDESRRFLQCLDQSKDSPERRWLVGLEINVKRKRGRQAEDEGEEMDNSANPM